MLLETIRCLISLSDLKPDILREIISKGVVAKLIILSSGNGNVFDQCSVLMSAAICESQSAFDQVCNGQEFVNALIDRVVGNPDADIACFELLMILSEDNGKTKFWFTDERLHALVNHSYMKSFKADKLEYSLSLSCILLNILASRNPSKPHIAADLLAQLISTCLQVIGTVAREVFSKSTEDEYAFVMAAISKMVFVANYFNDGEDEGEDEAVIEEAMVDDEMQDGDEAVFEDDGMVDEEIMMDSSAVKSSSNEAASLMTKYYDFLKSNQIIQSLLQLEKNEQSPTAVKFKAINTLSDIFMNMTPSYIRNVATESDFVKLYFDEIWTQIKQLSSHSVTDSAAATEQIARFILLTNLMWTLGRGLSDDCKIKLPYTADFFHQEWMPLYKACFQMSCDDDKVGSILNSVLFIARTNLTGLLSSYAVNQPSLQSAEELHLFLMDRMQGTSSEIVPHVEQSQAVIAELVNAFIDLHAQDDHHSIYKSHQIPLIMDTMVKQCRAMSKSIDPRKPLVPQHLLKPALLKQMPAWFASELMERVEMYLDARSIRDRMWDMYVNMNRFKQYKAKMK